MTVVLHYCQKYSDYIIQMTVVLNVNLICDLRRAKMRLTGLYSLIWRDGLLGHRTQVILKKIPNIDPRCIILDQEHSRPCRRPL